MPIDEKEPVVWGDKEWEEHFDRTSPYRNVGNTRKTSARQLIIELGEKLKGDSVTDQELVQFFHHHKLVFHNDQTNMYSNGWYEDPQSYSKAKFVCVISCSCECGPMDDPCNLLGPGSKPDFTFKKEE